MKAALVVICATVLAYLAIGTASSGVDAVNHREAAIEAASR